MEQITKDKLKRVGALLAEANKLFGEIQEELGGGKKPPKLSKLQEAINSYRRT